MTSIDAPIPLTGRVLRCHSTKNQLPVRGEQNIFVTLVDKDGKLHGVVTGDSALEDSFVLNTVVTISSVVPGTIGQSSPYVGEACPIWATWDKAVVVGIPEAREADYTPTQKPIRVRYINTLTDWHDAFITGTHRKCLRVAIEGGNGCDELLEIFRYADTKQGEQSFVAGQHYNLFNVACPALNHIRYGTFSVLYAEETAEEEQKSA